MTNFSNKSKSNILKIDRGLYALNPETGEFFCRKHNDSFTNIINYEFRDKKVTITKNKAGNYCINANGAQILEIENNKIVSVTLLKTLEVYEGFLSGNNTVRTFIAPKLALARDDFFAKNQCLYVCITPIMLSLGKISLGFNISLKTLIMPELLVMGEGSLQSNQIMENIYIPELNDIPASFLKHHPKRTRLIKQKNEKDTKFNPVWDKIVDLFNPVHTQFI